MGNQINVAAFATLVFLAVVFVAGCGDEINYYYVTAPEAGEGDDGESSDGPADDGPADDGPADDGPDDDGPADEEPADEEPAPEPEDCSIYMVGNVFGPDQPVYQELEVEFVRSRFVTPTDIIVEWRLTAPSGCSDVIVDYVEFAIDDDFGVRWSIGVPQVVSIGFDGSWFEDEAFTLIPESGNQLFSAWSRDGSAGSTSIDLVVPGGTSTVVAFRWSFRDLPRSHSAALNVSAVSYTDAATGGRVWRDYPADMGVTIMN
ncbi:MAG: hypothetical protein ABIJ46_00165 [bacterium]